MPSLSTVYGKDDRLATREREVKMTPKEKRKQRRNEEYQALRAIDPDAYFKCTAFSSALAALLASDPLAVRLASEAESFLVSQALEIANLREEVAELKPWKAAALKDRRQISEQMDSDSKP